ncbi:TrmH family RNA methyltransferase [Brockia lithotrophica]|uniref:TrmH family RNA methyltransferase n=1 Tax=Brockia lithotrophica TaxID=933949 RepID=A0A660KW06_9BACL|nr:RNA methyltransferase [Brockia lithotrophica]RKQ84615.1 TrmH family RNA methyltransferase [Brockia lithotrophica]
MYRVTKITSAGNPRVRAWRKLLTRSGRRRTGEVFLEGRRLVLDAWAAGAVTSLLLEEGVYADVRSGADPELANVLATATERRIPVFVLAPEVARRLAATVTPQGIFATARTFSPPEELSALTSRPSLSLVALAGVQDPGNVGTVLRTAEAAGVDGVLVLRGSADPYGDKVLRAGMGAHFRLPLWEGTEETLASLRRSGVLLLGADPRGDTVVWDVAWPPRFALVLGSEGGGIPREVEALLDVRVRIPIYGRAESLNVAVAAAVLLYAWRQARECAERRE